MNRSYQIVSESSLLPALTVVGTTFALWVLNKHIRTWRVLKKYPDPISLKKALLNSKYPSVREAAKELTKDMSPTEYKMWVMTKTSPKMSLGKAILMTIFSKIEIFVQGGKAIIHSGESADTIIDRAGRKGRFDNI